MVRLVCPTCKLVFFRVEVAGETGVTCPRCQTIFQPEEEELYDPENE
jgi:uncharacterized Zn finger protein (UPF0148 family)